MASVAADTSAIAPPLPLPSRSDAAPPAGPSSAFADLLDAQATSTPQVQGPGPASPPSAGAQDGSNQGPPGAGAAPAGAAPPKVSSGKNTSNGKAAKDGNDTAADNSGNGGSGVDPTAVAGLAIPPLSPDPVAVAADQSPVTSSDSQTGSPDPIALVNDVSTSKSSDPGNASAPSGPVAAGLVAIAPGIPAIAPVGSPVPMAAISAAAAIPGTSAPAAGLDPATTGAAAPQQSDGTALADPSMTAAIQDALVAFGAPAANLQNGSAPALPPIAIATGTPDQNPKLNPAAPFDVTAAGNAGNLSTLARVAPLNPLPLGTGAISAVQGADQTPANPGAARESDPALVALPAQVAARFAASMRAADDGTSDFSPDAQLASATSTGDTARSGNDQPGPIQPSFNLTVLTPVQATPGVSATPQHAAVTPDAVPLAGIPIAIAARVEAGEKRFEIRLDPPDLGRIEVTLSVDSSGRATSHLVVDRADTLDLLRRDAPALERALQSAGLTTGDGALQFSLRDQSSAGRDQGTPAPPPPTAGTPAESDVAPIDAAMRRYGPPAGLGSGIDIRV